MQVAKAKGLNQRLGGERESVGRQLFALRALIRALRLRRLCRLETRGRPGDAGAFCELSMACWSAEK